MPAPTEAVLRHHADDLFAALPAAREAVDRAARAYLSANPAEDSCVWDEAFEALQTAMRRYNEAAEAYADAC